MQLLGNLLVSGLVTSIVKLYEIVLKPILERRWELPLASPWVWETGLDLLLRWATQWETLSELWKEQTLESSGVSW